VTGAAFSKAGESREVTYITPNGSTKACPVPNYYWKALLKVKRSGTAIEKAYAIGFWLEHRSYSATTNNERYYDYAVSIDELERNLGIDLFVNLPEAREADAEVASDWTAFTKALKEE
jgi:endonuclease G